MGDIRTCRCVGRGGAVGVVQEGEVTKEEKSALLGFMGGLVIMAMFFNGPKTLDAVMFSCGATLAISAGFTFVFGGRREHE